jgi:hypothetical protein
LLEGLLVARQPIGMLTPHIVVKPESRNTILLEILRTIPAYQISKYS